MSYVAAGVAVAGLTQSVIGGIKASKKQKALEKLQTPVYTPNKAIGDYYTQALTRYNSNPYDTQAYSMAKNNAMAGTAAGLNALQGRRSSLAGVGKLVAIQDNALQRAAVSAEGQRNQEFNELGRATGMKAADDEKAFQYNKVMPYQKQAQLLGGQASGYNKMLSAGIQNLFGGAMNYAKLKSLKTDGGTGGGSQSNADPFGGSGTF